MLNWLFKKKKAAPSAEASPSPAGKRGTGGQDASAQAAEAAAQAARQVAERQSQAQAWQQQFEQATGQDDALLALALKAPTIDHKVAAVEALQSIDALRSAEREFRTHDRRVHRIAKQRLAQRQAQVAALDTADRLIASAERLRDEPVIAANRLVALDREWSAIDAAALDPVRVERFQQLTSELTALTLAQAKQEAQGKAWIQVAEASLATLQQTVQAAAEGRSEPAALQAAGEQADQAVLDPEAQEADRGRIEALQGSLRAACAVAAQVSARLALLDEAAALAARPEPQPEAPALSESVAASADAEPVSAATEGPADNAAPAAPEAQVAQRVAPIESAPTETPNEEVSSPPAEAPEVTDTTGDAPSDAREGAATVAEAEPQPQPAALAAPVPELVTEANVPAPLDLKAELAARWAALPVLADREVAQALNQRWQALQRPKAKARPPAPPRAPKPERPVSVVAAAAPTDPQAQARIDTLLADAQRALDEGQLSEAHRHLSALDTLAPATVRGRLQAMWSEHGRLKGWQQWGGARARDDLVAEAEALAASVAVPENKISVRSLSESIDSQRKRWKELDRTGGPANQSLWQRFDAALQAAHVPVAAQHARVDAERQANLAQRQQLLDELAATPSAADSSWRDQVRALDAFQTAWRKLGPLEHTVPHAARQALVQRWRETLARVEEPLAEVRGVAQREREALIEQALNLGQTLDPSSREAVPRVRELQAQWQEHARQVPLARAAENGLWARFKAATDAVFAQREAVFQSRDDELRGHLAAREAIVAGLEALDPQAEAAQLRQALREADQQWRHAGDAPRQEAARVERAYRQARDTVQQRLSQAEQDRWSARVQQLQAAFRHLQPHPGPTELPAELASLDGLPAVWVQAVRERAAQGPDEGSASTLDRVLLQAEMALGIESPEAYQADRRELKLQAMKAALESRSAPIDAALSLDQALARVLRAGALSQAQRERADALLQALTQQPR